MRGQKVRLQAAADMRLAVRGGVPPRWGGRLRGPVRPCPPPPPGGGERHTVPVTENRIITQAENRIIT
jgi:hypothetical protein